MSSPLSQSTIASIVNLRRSGVSMREIARRLKVHRATVGKYLSRLESQISNGDGDPLDVDPMITHPSAKRSGSPSRCEPFRDLIIEKVNQGMTAQKIYQRLVSEQQFDACYYSVRRYVAKLLDGKKLSSDVTPVQQSRQGDPIQ